MSDENLEIRVTANAADAQRGMKAAADAVQSGLARIRGAFAALRGQVRADTETITRDTARTGSAMQELASNVRMAVAGFAGFQAAKALIETADQATLSAARMKQVTGSLEQAREASRGLFEMSQRLQAPFADAQAMFARMLPAVQELKGGVREATALSEILISTARLGGASAAEASAGAQQFAQALGSGVLQGDELKSILENNSVLARQLASALGVTIGELRKMGEEGKLTSDLVANALLGRYDEIKAKTAELPQTVGGAFTQISNAAQQLWGVMNTGEGTMATLARTMGEVAKVIELVTLRLRGMGSESDGAKERSVSAAQALGKAFAYVVDVIGAVGIVLTGMGEGIGAVAAAAARFFSGDFTGAKSILSEQLSRDEVALQRVKAALSGAGDAVQAYSAIVDGAASFSNEGRNAGGSSTVRLQGAPVKGKEGAKEASQMPIFEAELAKKIEAFERAAQVEGTLRQYAKQDEASYWQSVSQRAGVSAEDRARAEKKWRDIERDLRRESFDAGMQTLKAEMAEARMNYAARVEIAEEAHRRTVAMYGAESKEAIASAAKIQEEQRKGIEQGAALRAEVAQRKQDQAMAEIESERQAAQLSVQLGLMTNEQLLTQEMEFEERRKALKLEALQSQLAGTDPQRDPVAYAQLLGQIEQLETEHTLRMQGIRGNLLAEVAAPAMNVFSSMQQSFAGAIEGMMNRTMSLRQAMANIWAGIRQTVVKEIAAMLAKKVAAWAVEKGLTLAGIGAKGAEAAAGSAKAVSSIPYVGPILAMAAMASTLSAVTGLKSSVPSAAGGFDIPAGMNPMTQLHEREMVLPAQHADVIRGLSESGTGGASVSVSLSVNALDGASVKRVLLDNRDALGAAVKAAVRDGHFTRKDMN